MKKYKELCVRIISILFMIIFIILPTIVNAQVDLQSLIPAADTGNKFATTAGSIMGNVRGAVQLVADSIIITMLIYIGIKYVLSAPEGRAEYRKTLLPYIVGVVLIKGGDNLVGMIEAGQYNDIIEPHVSGIQTAVQNAGWAIAVIMLIIIGIKYVMAAPEGKAEYRKTMTPYIVGAVLIYGATNIAPNIANGGNEYWNLVSPHLTGVQNAISLAGESIAIIMLLIIGIKYMTVAPEGKAEYRKIMVPYLIGAIIVFTTAFGSNAIINTIKGQAGVNGYQNMTYASETQSVLSTVISVLKYVGVGMAIIMLIVLALKYMTSAPEGKAEFQKTAVPYVIGAVILFATYSIVNIIQTFAEGL